jgi:hypothetical protein
MERRAIDEIYSGRCAMQEADLPPRDALTTRRDYTGVEGESIVKVLERRGSMGMSMAMTFGAGVRLRLL